MPHRTENDAVDLFEDRSAWWNPLSWLPWQPTSLATLLDAEKRMLSDVTSDVHCKFVSIQNGAHHIRTMTIRHRPMTSTTPPTTSTQHTPVVLLHGMGSGIGLWSLNCDALAAHRTVYALDLPGFAASSRGFVFAIDPVEAESQFVECLDSWRAELGLTRFIMLGHSLGGFLATSYAIKYPQRVAHLILADPWGFPERPAEIEKRTPQPAWVKLVAGVLQVFNPFAPLRAVGPLGTRLVALFRPDLIKNYKQFDDNTVAEYIYHCNAQTPSGEIAFRNMSAPIGWAKEPMVKRVTQLPRHLPMSLLYGSRSWLDSGVGWQVKFSRNDSYVDVQVIKGAGHHLYADKADAFNNSVNRICRLVDQETEQGATPFSASKRRRTQSDSCLPLQDAPAANRQSESKFPTSKTADPIPEEASDDDDEYIPTLNFGAAKTEGAPNANTDNT